MTIDVVRGSVLAQSTEAIVNAANTSMRGGGGVDGAIHRAAGPDLLIELYKVAPHGAKTSQVVVTQGHKLPHKWILHGAGPFWSGGDNGEEPALAACYQNALVKADELGANSIAFPSISTGIYRFPLKIAAPLAVRLALDFQPNTLERIVFAMFGDEEFAAFRHALEQARTG